MMTWVQIHCSILRNPKLMRAARDGSQKLHLLPWLIVKAGIADDGGRLSIGPVAANADDLASGVPGVTAGDMIQCLAELRAIRTLDVDPRDGVFYFVNWKRYQSAGWKRKHVKPSDSPGATRLRKARSRARQGAVPT